MEVARTSSFGRAAANLHLDPSTVSRQVAQLERRIGVQLFERTTRQVWLTAEGEQLLGPAGRVVDAADDFRRTARAVERRHGQIVLGFQTHALNKEVLDWINVAEEATGVGHVRLLEGNFTDPTTGLRDRTCDLALVFAPFDDEGIELQPLVELPWLMFLPADHPLAGRSSLHLAEVLDEPWVRPDTDDEVFRSYWLAEDVREGRPPPPAPAYGTPDSALAVIATGRALGVGASLRDPIPLDGVVAVPVDDDRRATVALAWRDDGLSARAATLRDALLADPPCLTGQRPA